MKKSIIYTLVWALVVASTTSSVSAQSPTQKPLERAKDRLENRIDKIKENRPRAVISSGKLTAKNGNTLTGEKDGKSYTILVDDNTQLRRRFWGNATLDEMQVGDTINVVGSWTDDTKTTITAKILRDTSIQTRRGVFLGTVTSISGTTITLQTPKRGTQTATLNSNSQLKDRKNTAIVLTDIKVGHKLRIKGLWNRNGNTITDVVHVKDFSIPEKPTPNQ